MANVPFPIQGETLEEVRYQIYELIRTLFEEKIGGADLGDVFSIVGDVLTLALGTPSGMTKTGNVLAVDALSTGGLEIKTTGLSIKIVTTGGLETDASGAAVKLDGTSLTKSAAGLRVSADLIDWPTLTAERLVATDAGETLVSSDLDTWIAGTTNQVIVTDDGDGSVTLSLPQSIDITALEGQIYYSGGQ
jgi:hypothetical protein